MPNTLTTRDGLVGNSPRYAGYLSPPYKKYLKDDSGAVINLTGVPTGAFGITMVNQSNPMLVKSGGGVFSVPSPTASQGLMVYQYALADLATPGNWFLFVTVQIPGETGQRAFDPDFLIINIPPGGGLPIVTVQQVDLEQLGGTQLSPSNPMPIAGPISIPDGANISQGATTDSASASTQIGLLKAIKAYLGGTLSTATTEANSAAILSDIASMLALQGASGDANTVNSMMGRLTKIRDLLNAALTIQGTITEVNSSSINTHLANIDTDSAAILANTGNTATNTSNINTHAANIDTATAASKTDLDTIVTNTGRIPTSPATESGHLATIDSVQGTAGDANTVASVMGRLTKLRDLLNSLTDTFGSSTPISAATTFGTIPLVSALAVNSFATLTNNSYQDTFLVQINVASAFVGTIGFYGLLPDGATLQQINAHQRGTATNGNSSAINTGSALEQTWEGSIAAFKAIYVACTAFTSGSASVQIALTAANYAHAIINTVAQNLTQVNGSPLSLGRNTKSASLPVTMASDQDSINVAVTNTNPNGQATSVNSAPVAIASDYVAPVKSVRFEVIGQSPSIVNAINTDLIPSNDTTGYTCAVLQLTGLWTATLQSQQCNDNATFLQTQMLNAQTFISATGLTNSINSTNGLYIIPLSGRYLRVRATAFTSNASLVGTLELYTTPPPFVLAALATYATLAPQTSGGITPFHLISAASTNLSVPKNGQGQVYDWFISNTNAAYRYVKLFNKTSNPVLGTDTPLVTIAVPPNGTAPFNEPQGVAFGTGIALATTTGSADSDTNAVGAGDLIIHIGFK